MTQKVMLHLTFGHLILKKQKWYWQGNHKHILLTLVPVVSHQKSQAAPHFNQLNLCNGAFDDAISVMWSQHWQYMTKEVMLHLVLIILLLKQNGAIENAPQITSHLF